MSSQSSEADKSEKGNDVQVTQKNSNSELPDPSETTQPLPPSETTKEGPKPRYIISNSHKYVIRPVRVLLSVGENADCKYTSSLMQTVCFRVGLLTTFDVFKTPEECVFFLNSNDYDIVFIHQELLCGKQGEGLVINLQFLLSYTPVIIMGISDDYGHLMSFCDFSAFLRLPFSASDFLHYLLKYVYEMYETKIMNVELQKIPRKDRLRYQVMNNLKKMPSDGHLVVGIPVAVSLMDNMTVDEYMQKSRFTIPQCYQLPISDLTTTVGVSAKQASETMAIPLLSPNQDVPTQNLMNPSVASSEVPIQVDESSKQKNVSDDDSYVSEDMEADKKKTTKPIRKRVSGSKKYVRARIEEFVAKSGDLYDKMNNIKCASIPPPKQRKSSKYVSIAPRV